MTIATRIYASTALAFGGQPAIDDLISAGYAAVIVWSVHVHTDGTVFLNDTQIVSGGVYKEADVMNLPRRLAQLRGKGLQIIFSVGSAEVDDFRNIGRLLNQGTGPGTPLYDNFKALKAAMVAGGGDIDAIDFDNEDYQKAEVMVAFGAMLESIGYKSVTLCPAESSPTQAWIDTYTQLLGKFGKGFVSAIHLQCYSGGRGNSPKPWGDMIANNGGSTLLIPGLATNQPADGPWWDKDNGAPGKSVVKTPGGVMSGSADWSKMLRKGHYASADLALQDANLKGGESFFFYCRGPIYLGPGKQFQTGDAVFFAGVPFWGTATQCDGYALSGKCSNRYNDGGACGACPDKLQSQYASWKEEKNQQHPPDGGFIWFYDSVVDCLLAGCCGGTEKAPKTTATAYREAITNGLSSPNPPPGET